MSRIKLAYERRVAPDLPTAFRLEAPRRQDGLLLIEDCQQVVITGVRIPFLDLTGFLIQLALALTLAGGLIGLVVWCGMLIYPLIQAYISGL